MDIIQRIVINNDIRRVDYKICNTIVWKMISFAREGFTVPGTDIAKDMKTLFLEECKQCNGVHMSDFMPGLNAGDGIISLPEVYLNIPLYSGE